VKTSIEGKGRQSCVNMSIGGKAASDSMWWQRWKGVVEDEVRVAVRTGMDAVERGTKLEDLVADCNEQPAQFATPWVKVHGRTMYEWSLYLRSTQD